MDRAICGVQLKYGKGYDVLLLGLNEATYQLAMGRQCSLVWSCVEEGGWSCLEKRLYFGVECQGNKGRLKKS